MTTNVANPPFCRAIFFDRFEAGKTVLYLEFVSRQKTQDTATRTERMDILSFEVLGVYAGRDGDVILINPGFGAAHKILAVDVRGLKEIPADEIGAIASGLCEAAAFLGGEDASETVRQMRFLNHVRGIIDRYSLLLPRLRLPS